MIREALGRLLEDAKGKPTNKTKWLVIDHNYGDQSLFLVFHCESNKCHKSHAQNTAHCMTRFLHNKFATHNFMILFGSFSSCSAFFGLYVWRYVWARWSIPCGWYVRKWNVPFFIAISYHLLAAPRCCSIECPLRFILLVLPWAVCIYVVRFSCVHDSRYHNARECVRSTSTHCQQT